MPSLTTQPLTFDGVVAGSTRNLLNSTFEQQCVANTTVVQATNPTSATNLMTATLPVGFFTAVGQSIEIWGAGIVNLTTTTSAVTIAIILGGVTIATFTTGSYAISLNLPWNVSVFATVTSITASQGIPGVAVTLEVHGTLQASLTTAAGSTTAYNDTNTAVSSSISNTAATVLQVQATLAAGNAASFVNQRQLCVEFLN